MVFSHEKFLTLTDNLFRFSNYACRSVVDIEHISPNEIQETLKLQGLDDKTITFAFMPGRGLVKLNNDGSINEEDVLQELLSLSMLNKEDIFRFFAEYGFFFPININNFEPIDINHLKRFINRIKALIQLISDISEANLDYFSILNKVLFLQLSEPSEFELTCFQSQSFKTYEYTIYTELKKAPLLSPAIMPSKYTDEIENSSYTWRVFYMSRKSKYSAEQKLAILNELTRSNISEVAKKYAVGKKTIRTWGYLYEYQGIDGLRSTHNNHRYSREFKLSLVQQYQKSDESLEIFAIKHGLKSKTQLSDWIMQYNESNLKAYTPRKRDSKMSGRKTDFEERLTIIEELIRHDVNYNWAVEKYHISYQQVYGWYQKYRKSGNDPESLRDRRGKAKPEEKWTEVDRLKAENRLLRAQLEKQEMEIAFAKKLTEIRNREVEKDSGTKPSKN